MAKKCKPVGHPDRKTCMVVVPLLFVDTYPARKMLEVVKGIEYIHSEGVVHGDLRGVFYSKQNMLRC